MRRPPFAFASISHWRSLVESSAWVTRSSSRSSPVTIVEGLTMEMGMAAKPVAVYETSARAPSTARHMTAKPSDASPLVSVARSAAKVSCTVGSVGADEPVTTPPTTRRITSTTTSTTENLQVSKTRVQSGVSGSRSSWKKNTNGSAMNAKNSTEPKIT
eukprot:Amastigsp_a175226_187.p3 type:complete len:159 gc:universal Amastigsp_a175226_187:821-1297(+)